MFHRTVAINQNMCSIMLQLRGGTPPVSKSIDQKHFRVIFNTSSVDMLRIHNFYGSRENIHFTFF